MPRLAIAGAQPTELYYEDQGSGPPVVLIHGWPVSGRMWEQQLPVLVERGFRVVTYDRRGFGQSARTADGYDYDTLADDLHALMEHLDLRGAALVGFSMGGGEVVRYLARHGAARVSRIALLGAVTPFLLKTDDNPHGVDRSVFDDMLAQVKRDRIAFLDSFFPAFYGQWLGGGELVAWTKSLAWPASPIATQKCIPAFGFTDFRADCRAVSVPALLIHGTSDTTVPIDSSARLAATLIPGARLEEIRGAPHGFPATHPDDTNRLLLDFLS